VPDSVTSAIGAAAECSTWYLANFVPTAGQQGSTERRTSRWGLRGLNRQDGVSALRRPAQCGLPIGNNPVKVKQRADDGGSHFSGVETCASVWACPVCAASIRNHRAEEITRGLGRHIGTGGGALLVTLTLPHQAGDALAATVALVSDGFRALQRGRAYAAERNRYGILGHIRAFEVTHSPANGWHPHLHVVVVTAGRLKKGAAEEIEQAWQTRWNRWLVRCGWPESAAGIGVRVDRIRRGADAVAVYVAKLQEGKEPRKSNVANEMTRADLKRARQGSRVPFEILADFGNDGSADDLDLWHEYQRATKGRSAIRWSRGLRALLLPDEDELTDEEITEEEVGGDVVAVIAPALYRAIARRPYGEAYLTVAAERGGLDGIRRYVRALGMNAGGVHPPEALTNWAELQQLAAERDEA
jgi:hypothetical protein